VRRLFHCGIQCIYGVTPTRSPEGNLTMTQIKATQPELETSTNDQIVAEDLIEEVSIDGMCGVY